MNREIQPKSRFASQSRFRVLSWSLGLVVNSALATQEINPDEIGYRFNAVELRVKSDIGEVPVVSAGRWGLQADLGHKLKRFGYSSDFRLLRVQGFDTQIVEIRRFDIALSYARQNELEAHALGEVQHYQMQTDIAIANMTRPGAPLSPEQSRRISELEEDYRELEKNVRTSIESGDFESEELNDLVTLKLTLVSPRQIPNAFCVVVMRYQVPDRDRPGARKLYSAGRVRWVGNLASDKPRNVTIRFRVPEGYLDMARYDFHLLSGTGEGVATTRSPGLSAWSLPPGE